MEVDGPYLVVKVDNVIPDAYKAVIQFCQVADNSCPCFQFRFGFLDWYVAGFSKRDRLVGVTAV